MYIDEMVKAGRQDELPYKKMELTTAKAEAARILRLKDGPEYYEMKFTCLRFGDIAFVGLPGEPFTGLGRQIIAASPFDTTIVCCLTNGGGFYYPTTAAYDEGGYEAKSSPLKKGVAERKIPEDKLLRMLEACNSKLVKAFEENTFDQVGEFNFGTAEENKLIHANHYKYLIMGIAKISKAQK